MGKVIVVTGAANGVGKSACGKLAQAGHTVYAAMRRNERPKRAPHRQFQAQSDKPGIDLRVVELDVSSETSVNSAIELIIAESGRLDVVVHNVGQIVYGPTEALTSEQLVELFNTRCTEHATRQSRGIAAVAQARARTVGMGLVQQRTRRFRALSRCICLLKSGARCTGAKLRRGTCAVGH